MNTSIQKITSLNRGKSTLLFTVAILMLIFSCPLKRLILTESHLPVSAQTSVRRSGNESLATAQQQISCCALKQKITLVNSASNVQHLAATDCMAAENPQTGFAVHYFLNGTSNRNYTSSASTLFSLPLFLQHRRLRI